MLSKPKGVSMGEAEDVVARRRNREFADARVRYEACLAEMRQLAPRAAANLKKHGYPESYRVDVRFRGEQRVAWTLYYDGWGGNLKIDLLADGTIVKNDGSSHSDRIAFVPLPSNYNISLVEVEIMEEVVSRLNHFASQE